jgi:hypothetical protein
MEILGNRYDKDTEPNYFSFPHNPVYTIILKEKTQTYIKNFIKKNKKSFFYNLFCYIIATMKPIEFTKEEKLRINRYANRQANIDIPMFKHKRHKSARDYNRQKNKKNFFE